MAKTREEVQSTLYEIAEDLKEIGDKYAYKEYHNPQDFSPIAAKFRSVMNYLLNPHLDPKDVIE